MIDDATFERRLFAWLDGELPETEAAEMDAYCAAKPAARARVDAERAFEDRMKTALLASAGGREAVEAALVRARSTASATGAAPAPSPAPARVPAGKVVRMPRWIGAAAAVLVCGVTLAWFQCIPPFECPYVDAMEEAAIGEGRPVAAVRADTPVARAVSSLGWTARAVDDVGLSICDCGRATRRRVDAGPAGEFAVLELNRTSDVPSCRNKEQVDGETWWIGEEDGHTVVCFRPAPQEPFVAVVGGPDRTAVVEASRTLRRALARVSE